MNTNIDFLEDHMMDRKPNDRFDLKELFDTPREPLQGSSNPIKDVLKTIASSLLDTWEPRRRILESDELYLDPRIYNDAISDKKSGNWQSA